MLWLGPRTSSFVTDMIPRKCLDEQMRMLSETAPVRAICLQKVIPIVSCHHTRCNRFSLLILSISNTPVEFKQLALKKIMRNFQRNFEFENATIKIYFIGLLLSSRTIKPNHIQFDVTTVIL